jgi:hypothetical protein
MTLAYVFWHWTDAPVAPYVDAQRAFHAALAAHRPGRFRGSDSAAIENASWIPGGAGFEDRYFVEDFAALGLLNAGAVEGARKEPHDRAAARAAGGCAGIYLLRGGDAFGPETGVALWTSKPAGTSYATFLDSLRPALGKPGVSLWQRQMVLGPTPEFCLRALSAPDLPDLTAAATVPFRRVLYHP